MLTTGSGWFDRRRATERALAMLAAVALLAGCSSKASSPPATAVVAGGSTSSLAGAPAASVARPSVGCGTAAALSAGTSDHTLRVGQFDRKYELYVPTGSVSAPRPLILNFHGYAEPYTIANQLSGLTETATAAGALLVAPSGLGSIPAWNVFGLANGPDEGMFISALLDQVEHDLCIDTRRIFAAGLSNGGQMTSYVACRLADRIAAFAPVAGLWETPDCHPSRPVPIMAFHGTADTFLPYTGGLGPSANALPRNEATESGFQSIILKPVPEVLDDWAQRDGCAPKPSETPVSPHVTLVAYSGCRPGAAVQLYRIDGGGHAWPGSKAMAAFESVVGPVTMEIDASKLIWDFFSSHTLPG